MEVYSLSGLTYTIPPTTTGIIEYSGNTIPIQLTKGSGSIFSPDVLTLNSDNISSGRRKLGMLVYVYETNKIYQFRIDNYDTLWNNATGATGPGGPTVVISDYGTTVKNNSPAGINFISAWTSSTISGIGGYNDTNSSWRVLSTSVSGGSGTFTGGTVSGATIFTNGLTANTISATTYYNLPKDIFVTGGTYSAGTTTFINNTGGTFNVTGFSTSTGTSFTGGTVSGATIFTNGLTANTISATTYQNLNAATGGTYYNGTITLSGSGLLSTITGLTIPITGGTFGHGPSQINNILTLFLSDTTSFNIDNLIDYSELTYSDLYDIITSNPTLIKSKTYKVNNCDSSLYFNGYDNSGSSIYTTVYIKAIEVDRLEELGVGVFYTPKYDTYQIFSSANTYNQNDKVIWGGHVWECNTDDVNTIPLSVFSLDSYFDIVHPFNYNSEYDSVSYNINYDEIKFDYINNKIIYRNEKNTNIVSTNVDNILHWQTNISPSANPIKAFQWGRNSVISNQVINNSYNENINFNGLHQRNFYFDNLSYQLDVFVTQNSYQEQFNFIDGSYQTNGFINENHQSYLDFYKGYQQSFYLDKSQTYIFIENGGQINFKTYQQSNTTFKGVVIDRDINEYKPNGDEDGLYFIHNLPSKQTQKLVGKFNNQLIEVSDFYYDNNINTWVLSNNLSSTNISASTISATTISAKTINVDTISATTYLNVLGLKYYSEFSGSPSIPPLATGIGSIALGDGARSIGPNMFVYGQYAGSGVTNTTGGSILLGQYAGQLATNIYNSNFLGSLTGSESTNANNSNFFGSSAGQYATNANNSNFFGFSTGRFAMNASYSTLIGFNVGNGSGVGSIGSNNIIIGTNISLPVGTTNSINIGGVLFGINAYSVTGGAPSTVARSTGRIGINVVSPQESLHVSGNTLINGNLSATTISATTYYNLPVSGVTGGTGISANTTNGVVTIVNTSPDQTVTITGGTNIGINGSYPNFGVSFTGSTGTSGNFLPLSGGTVTGNTIFTSGLTSNTFSAGTYYNLPPSTFSGGTVSGATNFTNGLTANTISSTTITTSGVTLNNNGLTATTISATTYYNLPSFTGAYLPLSGGTVFGNTIFTSGLTTSTLNITNYIDFNTGTTNPSAIGGRVFFDNNTKSLSYYDIGSSVVPISLGQQLYVRVYNVTGTQIDKGKVISITGTSNNLPSAKLSTNNHTVTSTRPVGLAAENIPNNSEGLVIVNGILSGITLNTFANGDTLYLSDTVPGGYVNSTSSLSYTARTNEIGYVIQTGTTTGKIYVTINNEDSNLSLTDIERNILEGNVISTGVYQYTGMTQGTGQTINVSMVRGWIVRNTYDYATLPDVTNVYYAGGTNIPLTYLNTADASYVLLNSGSTLYQQTTFPTPQQRRENIFLGKVVHPNRSTITSINQTVDFDVSPMAAIRDLWTPLKLINQGILTSPHSTTLEIDTSAGTLWGNGIGWTTNQLNPDSVSISGTSPTTFQYRSRLGPITGGTAPYTGNTTFIDPANYDNNGVITSVGGGSNSSTNQRVYLFPTGLVRIQYGQQEYGSLSAAVTGSQTETFVEYGNNRDNGILIGILSVNKNATNLSDTGQAVFNFVSKFGEIMGGTGGLSTTTLQQAYDNSTNPEIVINSTLGGLSIKNGTGNVDSITNLLEGQNSGGVITSFIRANGGFSGLSVSATTYYGLPSTPFLPLSGGTVTGETTFTNGLTANTISATTYQNLNAATGGTYSNGTITLRGSGVLSTITGLTTPFTGGTVSGATTFTNGLTTNTISATTYQNLPDYLPLSGGTLTGTTPFVGYTSGSTPSAPTSGFRLYADTTGMFSWIGSNGFVRQFNASGITQNTTWVLPSSAGTIALTSDWANSLWSYQRNTAAYFFEDFLGQNDSAGISTSLGMTMGSTGTGSGNGPIGTFPNRTNQIGVCHIALGTTSGGTGSIRFGSSSNPSYITSGGTMTTEMYLTIGTLSTSTDRYYWGVGFVTSTNYAAAPQGFALIYDEGGVYTGNPFGASPNFRFYTSNGTTRTITNTNVVVTAGSWYKVRYEVNNTGSQILCYINDSLVATHTTNLPAVTTGLFYSNWFTKTTGTTSLLTYMDYFAFRNIFTNGR